MKNSDWRKALALAETAAKANTKEELDKIQHEIDSLM